CARSPFTMYIESFEFW
nr:immunoglobulin heavy chain junction region [Macaca mulatta]